MVGSAACTHALEQMSSKPGCVVQPAGMPLTARHWSANACRSAAVGIAAITPWHSWTKTKNGAAQALEQAVGTPVAEQPAPLGQQTESIAVA